jgi:peptidoglycan/LPS O-acetylase OafA/YrhL
MKSSNIRYLPQVDHLRGVAALWILCYHGTHLLREALNPKGGVLDEANWTFSWNPFWAVVYEGHTAVALFMVLSGFIFAYGAIGHRIHYGRFIGNRFLRIYPLYLTMIFLAAAMDPQLYTLESFLSTVLPLADFQTLPSGGMIALAWTVAVEFQFYLIFPFLLASLNEKPLKTVTGVIMVSLALRVLACSLGTNPRDLSYWHLAGRIDQFTLGMGAAYLVRHWENRRPLFRILFGISIPVALLAIFGFHRLGGWPAVAEWKLIWPTVEGAVWGLLIVGYVGSGIALPRLLAFILAWTGEISFSIYLLHYPVITALARHPDILLRVSTRSEVNAIVSALLLALPCILALSSLTFRVIELPFLRRRQKYLYE